MDRNDSTLEQLKRAAMLRRLQQRNNACRKDAVLPAIVPADRCQVLPLSWGQQRLWFLDQLDQAAGAAYHVPHGLRLKGVLNRQALLDTLNRIVARHEVLRTTFVKTASGPIQVVAPADIGFSLIEHDLRGMTEHEQ